MLHPLRPWRTAPPPHTTASQTYSDMRAVLSQRAARGPRRSWLPHAHAHPELSHSQSRAHLDAVLAAARPAPARTPGERPLTRPAAARLQPRYMAAAGWPCVHPCARCAPRYIKEYSRGVQRLHDLREEWMVGWQVSAITAMIRLPAGGWRFIGPDKDRRKLWPLLVLWRSLQLDQSRIPPAE